MRDPDASPIPQEPGFLRLLNHRLFLFLTGLLGLLAVTAWGYWYYQTAFQRPQRITELSDEAARLQSTQDELSRLLDQLSRPTQPASRDRSLEDSVLAPLDGIRSIDRLVQLAGRTGVTVSNLQVAPGAAEEGDGPALTTLNLSFKAAGSLGALADFLGALQEGAIPWLTLDDIQATAGRQQSTLTAKGKIYTLASRPAGAPPPVFLKGGSPPFASLVTSEPYEAAASVPVLSFSVESWFNGSEALRSLQLRVSQPQIVSGFRLYAESHDVGASFPLGPVFGPILQRDSSATDLDCQPPTSPHCSSQFDPEEDKLIPATYTTSGDGQVRLALPTPFAFRGHREQRFYLAADIQPPPDVSTAVEIEIPPGGATFTSGQWPDDGQSGFRVELVVKPRPPQEIGPLAVYSGGETPLRLETPDQEAGDLDFRLINPPLHGELEGEFPNMRYLHRDGEFQQDFFTYTLGDAMDQLGAWRVILQVVQPLTILGPEGGPEGSSLTLNSDLEPAEGVQGYNYRWTWSLAGTTLGSGNGEEFSFTLLDDGTYQVELEVGDATGAVRRATRTVGVTNVEPVVDISLSQMDGDPIILTAMVADPGSDDSFTYTWVVSKDGTVIAEGAERVLEFTPDGPGTYQVTLTVTDDDGGAGRRSVVIQVGQGPPVILPDEEVTADAA